MIQRFVAITFFLFLCHTEKSNRSFIKCAWDTVIRIEALLFHCVFVCAGTCHKEGKKKWLKGRGDPKWVWTRWIVVCLFICYPLSVYCAAPMPDYIHSIVCFQCLKWLIRIVCYVVVVIHRFPPPLSMNIFECIRILFIFYIYYVYCIRVLEAASPLWIHFFFIFHFSFFFVALCVHKRRDNVFKLYIACMNSEEQAHEKR